MMPLLEGLSTEELQRLYYNGSHCQYCGNETEYVDSIEVYQQSYGMIFICRPCGAWVNTHYQSQDHAFGSVAKKALRELRHKTHLIFDPLWEKKVQMGGKKRASQAAARFWLAQRMNIDIVLCHIGMFDIEQCEQAISICQELYLTPEQIKKKEADTQYRKDIIYFTAGELGFFFKEFNVNGKSQFELKTAKGKSFYYDPINKNGRFANKKKPSPIEDIEEFIIKNFQPI